MKNLLITALFLSLISGCSGSDEMRDYINQQTNPFITKHVNYALFTEIIRDKPTIFLTLQYKRNELNFFQTDSGFNCNLTVHLSVKRSELESVWDTSYVVGYHYKNFDETRLPFSENQILGLNVPAGQFTVFCILTDGPNTAEMKIQSRITVPSFTDSVQLSSIRFMNDVRLKKLSASKQLSIKSGGNSGIAFELSNKSPNLPVRVQLKITKVRSDTLAARPIQSLTPLEGSIETRGYKIYEPQYVFLALDTAIYHSEKLTHRFRYYLPDSLREGVYFAEVTVKRQNHNAVISPKEMFYVFPDNFPDLKTLKEAVEIVKYLAYPGEYEDIVSGGDSLLKENFDRFWLKLSDGNVEAAKKKLALFYMRVMEANNLFSNYKAGWKTDLGMIYILLGQPVTVQWQPTGLTWYYYYKAAGGNIPLRFNPIRSDEKIMGYYLERYFDYDDFFVEYRRLWERN